MDLTKGSSFVEYLVNRGFDVYLLDWGTPGYEDKNMKLDDYIMDYIPRAVQKVLRKSKADEVSHAWILHGWYHDVYFCSTSS